MNKNKNLVFSVILISLAFSACSKQSDDEGKEYFTRAASDGKGTVITGYMGNETEIRIPAKINNLPVAEIGSNAFQERGLVSVTIPNTVTTIGNDAFRGNKLAGITIPNSVTTIGVGAFAHNEITSITIPNSVTFIGQNAFTENKLAEITIPNNAATTIDALAFYNNEITSITIPNIAYIGDYAFHGNDITGITINANVKISFYTFDSPTMRGIPDTQNFYYIYLKNMMRAGTYTFDNEKWVFKSASGPAAKTEAADTAFIETMLREYETDRLAAYRVVITREDIIKVSASSELTRSQIFYRAGNLIDQTWNSWAEGAEGSGIGEYFTFEFDRNPGGFAGFALKNGHGNPNYYSQNNRVKSFKIYIDGNYAETITVKDSIGFEQYALQEPVFCKTIRFEIDDVYPGTSGDDTFVAEIAPLQIMLNDSIFYENILFWIAGSRRSSNESGVYRANAQEIASISDIDRLLLIDYLPFDSLTELYYRGKKSKVALLESPSLLMLTGNLPRLDGATAMYPLYSSFVRAVYPETGLKGILNVNEDYRTLLKWPYFPNKNLLSNFYGWGWNPSAINEKLESIVQCNTTSEAYRRLIDGETDIIFCYEPSQAETSAAAEKGLRFNLTPIAKDAFVFIVNENNVLENITQNQIRDIYSGRVTNWKTISGADEPVIAYQRPENSGSQTILQSIMRNDRLITPIFDEEYIPQGMGGMINKITSDFYNYNCAIGYTFLFYLTQMAGDGGVKALSVDGVAPALRNIQNNSYPFVQTVYAITTGNESENTRRFIEWILSAEGQELVVKTGYTPVR